MRRDQRSGCWLWEGTLDHGYGRLGLAWVHKLAAEHFFGPIPEGHQVDHLCRVRNCFQPAHLEVVSGSENMRRRGWGHRARRQRCAWGHDLSGHLGWTLVKTGGIVCRVCSGLAPEPARAGGQGSR